MPTCEELEKDFKEIKNLKTELASEMETGKHGGGYLKVVNLKNEINEKSTILSKKIEKIDPDKIDLRDRLAKEKGYSYIGSFNDGLAKAQEPNEDGWFFIDKSGEPINDDIYVNVGNFVDGVARVTRYVKDENGNLVILANRGNLSPIYKTEEFYIDKSGNPINDDRFLSTNDFSEGIGRVQKAPRNYYFIDKSGNPISEEKFQQAGDFIDGVARVQNQDGNWQFIDKSGNPILKEEFGYAAGFSDGVAAVKRQNEEGYCYINKFGKKIFEQNFAEAGKFLDGIARVRHSVPGEYFFIDKSGNRISGKYFESAEPFVEGFAKVNQDKWNARYYFIDKSGNPISQERYLGAESFSEGLALVLSESKGWHFIDKSGEPIIDNRYYSALSFKDGVAFVSKQKRDKEGKTIPEEYDQYFIDKKGRRVFS